MEDIFVPKSSPDDAVVRQLHTVTYVTGEKDTVERAFVKGYGLESSGWCLPDQKDREALNSYFGFKGDNWEVCAFFKTGEGANVQIRVIYNPDETVKVRSEYDGLIVGGATISFPKSDLYAHEKKMQALGFKSTIGVKEMEFQSPAGEVYTSAEIIYFAPENIYFLAVKRPDTFIPVGPSDPETGVAGAAYSARCINDADSIIEFLETVLGFEIRRDVIFPIGETSAMLLPEGSQERFIQAFAPGASTGYLVLMDHFKDNKFSNAPNLGIPHRGIVMWSFQTDNIQEVYERALAADVEIIHAPARRESPYLASQKTLLMKDPGGFMFEIFQKT